MRKQSHRVEQIQNILVIISKVDGKVKKCEIFIGEQNQIKLIKYMSIIPPVGVCLERRVESSIFVIFVS